MNRSALMPLLALLWAPLAIAQQSAHPTTEPSAADLIRAAIQNEKWIDNVDSFYARFDDGWTTPAEVVEREAKQEAKRAERNRAAAARAATRAATRATTKPTTKTSTVKAVAPPPTSAPASRVLNASESLVLAFDQHRVYQRWDSSWFTSISFWDGTLAHSYSHYLYPDHDSESFGLRKNLTSVGGEFFSHLPGFQATNRSTWFCAQIGWGNIFPDENVRLIGKEMFRGEECYVVERNSGWDKWYIGVDRPLLHGRVGMQAHTSKAQERQIMEGIAGEHHGPPVTNDDQWEAWTATLSPAERHLVGEEYSRRRLLTAYPGTVSFLLDYKEIAPDCWMAMTQGYQLCDDSEQPPIPGKTRTLHALDVRINQPIPDALFHMDPKEGATVVDATRKPLLRYTYKKHFEPQEWKAILDAGAQLQARIDQSRSKRENLVGNPAPPFPETSKWINSKALTWDDLKGKVVLVVFFANWSDDCRKALPEVNQFQQQQADKNIAIVGIYPADVKATLMQRFIEELNLHFPICTDVPGSPDERLPMFTPLGQFCAAFRVDEIPHAIVVAPDGKIAGSGEVADMESVATKLAAER